MRKSRPEAEPESPIPFTHGSNGEFVPRGAGERARRSEELFRRTVDERVRRLGISRREFVESAAGAATALWVINQTAGCGGSDGGANPDAGYAVDSGMTWDSAACTPLTGGEFILDVQTHHVNPDGPWRSSNPGWGIFFGSLPQASCGEADAVDCFNRQHYAREMFLNSDTSMAVLSAVPADPGSNPLEAGEIRDTREIINTLAGSQRLLIHGLVLPDQGQAQLDGMQMLAEDLAIGAWKVYTPYGGWRLDDPAIGLPFLDKAVQLGVNVVCAHKGLPLPGFDAAFASPEDIGVVAAMYPQIKFVVYHSGYETSITEAAYDGANPQGIDRLIKAVIDSGATNIYAELGSTWRNVMTDPTESAHVIGKLLRYLGEDRVVWGTDSIWYGTPQDQITAFRALEIPMSMQDMYGYPPLTPAVRGKIFGLNAAAIYGVDVAAVRCALDEDDIAQLKRAGGGGRQTFRGYGPASRREFFDFLKSRGGRPG